MKTLCEVTATEVLPLRESLNLHRSLQWISLIIWEDYVMTPKQNAYTTE